MASQAANRLLPKIVLVFLSIVFAYLAVTWYLSGPHQAIVIAAPAAESKSAQKVRLGREQSAKDWGAAQKRADARNAAAEAR
jgi:hypothetical protein